MMMARYRKRPVVIDAFRFGFDTFPAWFVIAANKNNVRVRPQGCEIVTLEGTMMARPGDFIIRGVSGELYPCRAEIFAATYEPIDESTEAH